MLPKATNISYKDHVKNEKVRRKIQEEEHDELLNPVNKWKRFFLSLKK